MPPLHLQLFRRRGFIDENMERRRPPLSARTDLTHAQIERLYYSMRNAPSASILWDYNTPLEDGDMYRVFKAERAWNEELQRWVIKKEEKSLDWKEFAIQIFYKEHRTEDE